MTRPYNVYNTARLPTLNLAATVATPSVLYDEMNKKWTLIEDLRGGTEAMRLGGKTYLPQEMRESNEAYQIRLHRTFLHNLYWRTITSITGLAFTSPVVVTGVPKELEYLEKNFTGDGRSLTEIAYTMSRDAIHYGLCHAMMDFPAVETSGMSRREFLDSGFKPYCTYINPRNLIGWRTSEEPGVDILKQVRITESKVVASDINEWAEKVIYLTRVIHPSFTEVYKFDPEYDDNASYELTDTVENTIGYVPLVTAYGNKLSFMMGEPALYDLAMMNLRHYQSSSDQNNILHIARVPFLFAKGFEEGELENAEIGSQRIIVTSNEDADIKHVEHSGQAIGSGANDIKNLENQMAALGADLLVSKGVGRMTATARRLDQNESMSVLQMSLRSVEQAIEHLYQIAGDWLGVDASDVHVAIGDDMSVANEPNPTNALISLLDSGLITDEQAVEEAKRQGILSSYFKLRDERPRARVGFGKEEVAPETSEEDLGDESDDEFPEEEQQ